MRISNFFHNSSAYDSHLIIKYLHKKKSKITVIPSNTEQFIGFQIDGIRYLDSYKFLSSSLDDLVKNLHNYGVDRFKYTRRTFGDDDPNIFEKGVYPYELYDESRHFQANLLTIDVKILFETQNGGYNRARVQKSPRDVG